MPQLPTGSDTGTSTEYTLVARMRNVFAKGFERFRAGGQKAQEWYSNQPRRNQILIKICVVLGFATAIMVIVFHNYIMRLLVTIANKWESLEYGKLILFTLVFLVSFPPLLGYSALSLLSGMIYGFPGGWPVLAIGTVLGSLCSFIIFRYLLRSQAERLVDRSQKFKAFSEILNEDSSLLLLVLIRLCPLPYSLSNGALAAIPALPATTFFLASVLTTPKLLIHVFVGHKIIELGDSTKGRSTKVFDLISIFLTSSALLLVTYLIYKKMQQKLQSYHIVGASNDRFDSLIFGNFEDDLENGNNVELDSNEFDDDNFIIADDDDLLPENSENRK